MLGNDIQIKQLVGVGNVHLNFLPEQRVYCLIGENGIGKTKCLEALFKAYFSTNKLLFDLYFKGNHSFEYVDKEENKFKSIFTFGDTKICLYPEPKEVTIKNSAVFFPQHELPLVYVDTFERTSHHNNQVGIRRINELFLRRKYYLDDLNEIAYNNSKYISFKDRSNLHEWIIQRAQSANPYQAKEDNREIEITTLLCLLNKIDERFHPDYLEITGDDRVSFKVADKKTELSELSSGFASILKIMQSIIAGYSYFTNETNIAHIKGVVFIDEIESHLHTKWQATIVPTLKRLFPNTIFYITTHSAIVLSQLQHGEAYELYRDKEDGVVKTELIEHPNNAAFVDLLKDAFDIDINQLKLARHNAPNQKNAKKMLSELLEKRINELKEGTQL